MNINMKNGLIIIFLVISGLPAWSQMLEVSIERDPFEHIVSIESEPILINGSISSDRGALSNLYILGFLDENNGLGSIGFLFTSFDSSCVEIDKGIILMLDDDSTVEIGSIESQCGENHNFILFFNVPPDIERDGADLWLDQRIKNDLKILEKFSIHRIKGIRIETINYDIDYFLQESKSELIFNTFNSIHNSLQNSIRN